MLKFSIALGLGLLSACSPSGPSGAPAASCVPVAPAFRLRLTNSDGMLPREASLRVQHGAGCEVYSIAEGTVLPCSTLDQVGVVFCKAVAGVGAAEVGAAGVGAGGVGAGGVGAAGVGSAGGGAAGVGSISGGAGGVGAGGVFSGAEPEVQALECELYTDGPATLSVWKAEKKIDERELSAQSDKQCGLVTVDVAWDLARKVPN